MTITLRDIPPKLAVALVVLVLNGFGLLFGVGALLDEQDALAVKLAAARQQAPATSNRAQQVRRDIDEAAKLLPRYEAIMKSGFVANQDRLAVLKRLEELGANHALGDSSYRIAPEKTRPVQIAGQPHTLMSSDIELRNSALFDREILDFWTKVLEELPGRAATVKAELTRTGAVDQALLARLRKGERPNLVNGSITIQWQSLLPRAAKP